MRPSYALSLPESEDDPYPSSKNTTPPLKESSEIKPQSSPIRQRQPADDPGDLAAQLLRELKRLETPTGDDAQGEDAARLVRAYLHHGQLLVWRHVAHGNLSAPRQLLDSFRAALPFADVHAPELDFVQTAAIEIHATIRAWHVAEQALAEASARQGLADKDRSKLERAVLGVLLANSESYFRRKQVHGLLPLEGRPTVGRVGQILSKLADEGFVSRRRDRAQGDPETAFYAINDRGKDAARQLHGGLVLKRDYKNTVLEEAVAVMLQPSLPLAHRSIAAGLVASVGLDELAHALGSQLHQVFAKLHSENDGRKVLMACWETLQSDLGKRNMSNARNLRVIDSWRLPKVIDLYSCGRTLQGIGPSLNHPPGALIYELIERSRTAGRTVVEKIDSATVGITAYGNSAPWGVMTLREAA